MESRLLNKKDVCNYLGISLGSLNGLIKFLKWYEKLGENLVRKVLENFDLIEKEFYEDRNKEEVVDYYLSIENEMINNYRKIKSLKDEIEKMRLNQKNLKNYIVNKLRDEKKLINFLKNKDRKVLGKLKDVVDIDFEYNIVDKMKFEEEKNNRGSSVSVSLNN
jgi:HD superfamily phosphohydrolase